MGPRIGFKTAPNPVSELIVITGISVTYKIFRGDADSILPLSIVKL
jgi:hypothetical protein